MSKNIEDQGLEPDEYTTEESKLTKKKITYTRSFLISLHDWETCCDLPSDFDSSLLQEFYDDGSNGKLERGSTECNMSVYSSDDSEYALPQSLKCDDEDPQEKFTNWDGHSSLMKNKDGSNSERKSNTDNISQESSGKLAGNSSGMKNNDGHSTSNQNPDYKRSCEDRLVYSSENPDKDRIQAIPAFPGVSESAAAVSSPVSAPVVQEHYQLKKCANPYRPPHKNKGKSSKVNDTLNSGEGSSVTSSSDEQQNEKQSAKQPYDSELKSESEAINKSQVRVDQEHKISYQGDDKVIGGKGSYQDHEGVVLKELPDCAAEVKSSISAILSKNHNVEADNTLGSSLHHNKLSSSCIQVEKGSTSGNGPTDNSMASRLPTTAYGDSEQMYRSLTPTETRGVLMSSNEQTILSNGNESSSRRNHPAKEHNDYEIEYDQLNSADSANTSAFSVQIGLFNPNSGQNGSESYGTQLLNVNDDFLHSILDDSGAFDKVTSDCFLVSILDDCGAFDMSGAVIRKIKVFMQAEENNHEDENSDYQTFWDKISSIMRTQQEPSPSSSAHLSDGAVDSNTSLVLPTEEELYLSLLPNSGEIAEFNELCLPDEDSLITVNDLITPVSLEPPNENTTIHLNTTAQAHTQDFRSQLLSSGQGYTAAPYIPWADEHSLPGNNVPPNPNGHGNTVYYSVLEQPGNLVQQSEGATFADPMNQLGRFNNEARSTYFYPLTFVQPSYQGLRMPNPDIGVNNNQVIVNDGSLGMNLEAAPFGLAGYGQDISNVPASEYQNW